MMNRMETCGQVNTLMKGSHPVRRKMEHLSLFKHTVGIYIFFMIFFLTSWGGGRQAESNFFLRRLS